MTNGVLSTPEASLIDWVCPINWLSPLNRGLVSWWLNVPGMRGGSKWPDLCNRNHGTLTNMDPGTDWVGALGRPGGFGAVDCDGSNDNIPTGAGTNFFPSGSTAATISAWLRPASLASERRAVNFTNSFSSRFGIAIGRTANKFSFLYRNSAPTLVELATAGTYSTSEWRLVTCTGAQSDAKIYIDGVQSASATDLSASDTMGAVGSAVMNLVSFEGSSSYYSGAIDDARVWTRVLSASEVLQLYNDSRTGYQGTLNWLQRGGVDAAAAPASFQAAWAAHSNVILQPGAVL